MINLLILLVLINNTLVHFSNAFSLGSIIDRPTLLLEARADDNDNKRKSGGRLGGRKEDALNLNLNRNRKLTFNPDRIIFSSLTSNVVRKNPLPGYLSSSKDKGDEFEAKLDNVEMNIDKDIKNKKLAPTATEEGGENGELPRQIVMTNCYFCSPQINSCGKDKKRWNWELAVMTLMLLASLANSFVPESIRYHFANCINGN